MTTLCAASESSVISRYIGNPLLINGHKFDLRLYVVVTSYEPLRVYIFKEGLVRFASVEYNTRADNQNLFVHLTNYSINRKHKNFISNSDAEKDDVSFKWSLAAFNDHLESVGINMGFLWSRIFDVVIKTIALAEPYVLRESKRLQLHRSCCFEILGFDIMVDSELKPWVLEVNLNPSLQATSPLDDKIKTTLVTDTLNLNGLRKFDRKQDNI